jgi:hypothetical protein
VPGLIDGAPENMAAIGDGKYLILYYMIFHGKGFLPEFAIIDAMQATG